jgi:tetratricopeptide (TPR) repeat protein
VPGWQDAEGRSADALSFMQAAADLEKSIDTHDTLSPGPVGATAHESLGELLLKAGRAREALASFEESLKLAKDRARSYFGAAKAAGLAGDADRQNVIRRAKIARRMTPRRQNLFARTAGLPPHWMTALVVCST